MSYTPNPVPHGLAAPRSNYPSNSQLDSKESTSPPREAPTGAYRFIETAGAVSYRPVKLPGAEQRPTAREPLPDVQLQQGADGVMRVPYAPRVQHPNWTTSSNELGKQKPERFVTQEYRFFPRAHTFTNQFPAGNYRSHGLNTAKDEVRVHEHATML